MQTGPHPGADERRAFGAAAPGGQPALPAIPYFVSSPAAQASLQWPRATGGPEERPPPRHPSGDKKDTRVVLRNVPRDARVRTPQVYARLAQAIDEQVTQFFPHSNVNANGESICIVTTSRLAESFKTWLLANPIRFPGAQQDVEADIQAFVRYHLPAEESERFALFFEICVSGSPGTLDVVADLSNLTARYCRWIQAGASRQGGPRGAGAGGEGGPGGAAGSSGVPGPAASANPANSASAVEDPAPGPDAGPDARPDPRAPGAAHGPAHAPGGPQRGQRGQRSRCAQAGRCRLLCEESVFTFSKYHLPNTIVELCAAHGVTDLNLDSNGISTLKYLLSPTGLRNIPTLRKLSLCNNALANFTDLQLFQHSRFIKQVNLCGNPICEDPASVGMLSNLCKAMSFPISFILREPLNEVSYEPYLVCADLFARFNNLVNEGDSHGLAQLYTVSSYVVGVRPGTVALPPSLINWLIFLRGGPESGEDSPTPAQLLGQVLGEQQPAAVSPDLVVRSQGRSPSACICAYADRFLGEMAQVLRPSHIIDFQTSEVLLEHHEAPRNIYLPVERSGPVEAIPRVFRYTFMVRGVAQEHARHKPEVARTFAYVRWYVALAPFSPAPARLLQEMRIVSDVAILAET